MWLAFFRKPSEKWGGLNLTKPDLNLYSQKLQNQWQDVAAPKQKASSIAAHFGQPEKDEA